jgi:hypothetical protein
MIRTKRIVAAALTLLAVVLTPGVAVAGEMAVVVHPSNPSSDVTWTEVLAMFRGEQQHWKGGRKIYLILLEAGSTEREVMLKRVYGMTDVELKQFWLGKLYRGEIAAFPRVVASGLAARRIVAQAPNALAFIDSSAVDGTVKVLRIGGRQPGDPGYRLAAAP